MRTKRRSLLAKSLLLVGPRKLEWVEDMLPLVEAHDVVVETVAGSISTGSELPRFMGDSREARPLEYPIMTGYESYGRITSVGNDVPEQLLGEKVLGFYGHRTHAVMPLSKVIIVPSRVPPPTALLAILSCDVANGIRKLDIKPEEPVLVTGAGAIGLITVWMLRKYGVQRIHVLEPEQARCEKALALGASVAVHPEKAALWRDEFTVGIECSSKNKAFQLLQEKMAHNGRICVLSDGNREAMTLSPYFHQKELLVKGSSDGWDYQRHAVWFWQVVEDDHSLAEILFDLTIPHGDLPTTIIKLGIEAIKPAKVLVNYQVESW